MTDLTHFINGTVQSLQAPIAAYYDAQELPGILGKLQQARVALTTLPAFRRAIVMAMDNAALIAVGRPLTREQNQALDADKQLQVAYAVGFIADLRNETRAQAMARAASYASAITQVVSDVRTTAAERKGLPTLPIYPGDKTLACHGFCKCDLTVTQLSGSGNWDIYWNLHAQESCVDCVRLNQSWSPLQIRNYQVQQVKMVSDHDVQFIRAVIDVALSRN